MENYLEFKEISLYLLTWGLLDPTLLLGNSFREHSDSLFTSQWVTRGTYPNHVAVSLTYFGFLCTKTIPWLTYFN